MSELTCRTCGGELPADIRVCPGCGDRLPHPLVQTIGNVFVGLMLAVIAAIVLYAAYRLADSVL